MIILIWPILHLSLSVVPINIVGTLCGCFLVCLESWAKSSITDWQPMRPFLFHRVLCVFKFCFHCSVMIFFAIEFLSGPFGSGMLVFSITTPLLITDAKDSQGFVYRRKRLQAIWNFKLDSN